MANEAAGQLCLAQNQYAFLQDATKGTVSVVAGPSSFSLSGNDRPVVYDRKADTFVKVDITEAIKQNVMVPEGHYLVLENPAYDQKGDIQKPAVGSNGVIQLMTGRKIVIPGPTSTSLWPGQFSQVISGHHLRSNQYLVVRVYNADEAGKNAPIYLKSVHTDSSKEDGAQASSVDFTPGELLIIKGSDVSFFIPPTGFEVLKDGDTYVRDALTLELLEYCILLDEDGNKRYEEGPQVVFPEATERFLTNKENNRKFKAIELNDQMGLYIKVIAEEPVDEKVPQGADEGEEFFSEKYKATCVVRNGKANFKVGEELFITGKEQRIYYPRPQRALIEYDDPTKSFKRQRYYGITIPEGEGRYVLNKSEGVIKKEEGPQLFLPDPRNEVIVRRVLDDKTVKLWYPSNNEALTYNASLRSLSEDSTSYLAETVVLSAAADVTRSFNRGTERSKSLTGGGYEGDRLARGGSFTPPPMLTLSTKYDGIPAISVYTGYAVQVVDKSGARRVEIGPTNILLEYDETLEVLELSSGKPKNTDNLKRDVYLRVDNNIVSDIVRIETKDLVNVELKLSYRVNFDREHKDKWFSVENYVKYLCDHMRSLLKASMKAIEVKDVIGGASALIRETVLGKKMDGERRHHFFPENGMDVYDVEVLGITIADERIRQLLHTTQMKAVENAITMASEEQSLISARRKAEIDNEIAQLEADVRLKKQELVSTIAKAEAEAAMKVLENEIAENVRRLDATVAEQKQLTEVANAELQRKRSTDTQVLEIEKERVALFEKKMSAISPNMIQAIQTLGDNEVATRLATALAPLALHEQTSLANAMERVFKGTPLETVLNNISDRSLAAKSATSK